MSIAYKTWREWPHWAKSIVRRSPFVNWANKEIRFTQPIQAAYWDLGWNLYYRDMLGICPLGLDIGEGVSMPANWPMYLFFDRPCMCGANHITERGYIDEVGEVIDQAEKIRRREAQDREGV